MADTKISALTEDTAPDADADYLPTYDASASSNKRVNFRNQLKNAFRGALVKKSADQTAANYTTITAVAWDAETYDVGGWHDNSTNNSRMTVPSGVTRVRFGACIAYANMTADTWILLSVRKNGSATYDGNPTHQAETGGTNGFCTVAGPVIEVTAGDFFELFLQVETDTSIDITAARSWFSIEAA
jgi:hypothetical protein